MPHLKQSFSWWCFANKGVEALPLLKAAAKIGYDAVELIEPALWPIAHDAGLKVAAVAGHASIQQGMNRKENATRIEKELRENIDRAVEYRIPNLICFSGNREGISDASGLNNCATILERVLPHAEAAGVTLIMELLNSKVDHDDYQCDRSSWGIGLCQQLDSSCFKLLYDIYHMQIMEGDIIRTIQKHHTYFGHYHTAGNPGRGPLSGPQELNYPAIFSAISGTGFSGYIGHEFLVQRDPVEHLESTYRLCESSLRASRDI